ncbi:MAG TPA: hypothetical protein VJZ70_00865 [Limnochordia bacterium]|nr:hypothetical protein [Limnochordia bacterium]
MDKQILAVCAMDKAKVSGGAPIFYAADQDELSELAMLISRIFGAAAHDLHNGVFIIVKH